MILLTNYCVSQSDNYLSQKVKEFQNKKQQGFLFYNKNAQGEAATGNQLVFDEAGMMIVHQFDMNLVYFFKNDLRNTEVILSLNPPVQAGLTSAANGFLFFSTGDDITYMQYNGEVLFRLNPYVLEKGLIFTSFYYHANFLFFVDDRYKLYSIQSPSMDMEKNMANFRNPEQTKKLFVSGSDVDLKGLTMDEKGLMYVNGIFIGPGFMPVVGNYQYYMNQNDITIGDAQKQLTIIPMQTNDDEILESIAIHPSGDIYFLKYNKTMDKHILYQIKNTWDPAIRIEWYRNTLLLQ